MPKDYKKANVSTVFKKDLNLWKGDGTILEAVPKHVENKKVVRSIQHRFSKEKSCLNNLVALCNGTTGFTDEKRAVDVVYLDLRNM